MLYKALISMIFCYVHTLILVIRSVSDVLRAQSRLVKFIGVRSQEEHPTHFTNLLWVGSTSVTDIITNLSRR